MPFISNPSVYYYICDECAKANGAKPGIDMLWYSYDICKICQEMKSVSKSSKWKGLHETEREKEFWI